MGSDGFESKKLGGPPTGGTGQRLGPGEYSAGAERDSAIDALTGLGDAAANPRPHMGFGVAKAGGDAEALAHALRDHDDIDRALAAYNAARQPVGNTIVMHARRLGTHMGVNLKTDEDRRMHELLQSDEAMMDWIAVPNFLNLYK